MKSLRQSVSVSASSGICEINLSTHHLCHHPWQHLMLQSSDEAQEIIAYVASNSRNK